MTEMHKKRAWLTANETRGVFDLLDRGKQILAIRRETGIGKTKLYELKKQHEAERIRGPVWQPTSPLQQKLHTRCQHRSTRSRNGDHAWMNEVRFAEGFTVNRLPNEERGATPDTVKQLGYLPLGMRKCTTSRTCWFCSYTTKPESTWWPIDPLAEVFDRPPLPC